MRKNSAHPNDLAATEIAASSFRGGEVSRRYWEPGAVEQTWWKRVENEGM